MLIRLIVAAVALALIGLMLLGIGAGAGWVQISTRGIELGRAQKTADDGGPAKPVAVSADDLLRQSAARAAESSAPADSAPPSNSNTAAGSQAATIASRKTAPGSIQSAASTSASIASKDDPGKSAQKVMAPPFANAPSMPPIRIDAGSPAAVRDPAGDEWQADRGFDAGQTVDRGPIPIANTPFPELYRTERYDMNTWRRDVPNGKYAVNLHFAETSDSVSGPGQRVFHLVVQGNEIRDYDVFSRAGGMRKALVERFHVTVTTGTLLVQFKHAGKNVPEINGLEVIPEE